MRAVPSPSLPLFCVKKTRRIYTKIFEIQFIRNYFAAILMLSKPYIAVILGMSLFLCGISVSMKAQYGINLPIEKPKEFENRTLQSEKTDSKKFTVTRHFFQNLTSHYNYFFNANNKLNEVITKAKLAHKDDFSQLISFYNYSLDATTADSIELDSVSFKAQTAIVLHDLRSDWADNMYMLWGACYYLKQQFDSAYMMFQFINYAFAEKEKDGYYRTIGSARDGNNAFEIATKEKPSLTQRIFNEPPSRNDAFIWQIRNYLAQDKFAEASTLIQTLKQDPGFPSRLQNDLEEVQAYSFYRQEIWDSCAFHLSKALSNTSNKQEQARWEFLLGQLYEKTGNYENAESFYSKAIAHTTDPVMDVYARLSLVKVTRDDTEDYIDKNIASLLKMAKRDKYTDYRDIIYYMAAQMELERKNPEAAIPLFLKSTQYTTNNPQQRNRAFLELAELTFAQRMHRQSNRFYDSLQMNTLALEKQQEIIDRKKILTDVVMNLDIIDRQDSLQRIAQMPENDRKDFVKKLARQLRKQQGLKEEATTSAGAAAGVTNKEPAGLFADDNKKGEWYFYNTSLRQKGLSDFKAKWGVRPNADNWRRSAALSALINAPNNNNNGNFGAGSSLQTQKGNNTDAAKEITFENLYANLPLTEEQLNTSTDSSSNAMADLGIIYIQQLDDCISGTALLEQVRSRFPSHPKMDKVLYSLFYCYNNSGDQAKANEIKTLMNAQFADNTLTNIVTKGKNADTRKEEATREYEKVYDLFIEGNFAEALKQKKEADAKYGSSYWTPQLLYIESVYYIKNQEDSAAKRVLINITTTFPETPMAEKATTMLNVLNRRAAIEEELRNLVIEMPAEDSSNRDYTIIKNTKPEIDSNKLIAPASKDTVTTKPTIINPAVVNNTIPPKDTATVMPVVVPKQDSLAAVTPPKKDSITKTVTPPVVINNPPKDTVTVKPVVKPASLYSFEADKPVYVAVVMNKVDPIFVNEARNAFYRYNRDTYFNKQMSAELTGIDDDNRLLLLSPFKNVQEATEYIDKTQPLTSSQIVPWLKGGKYYFLVISEKNLPVLQSTKNIEQYRQFLQQYIPGKF